MFLSLLCDIKIPVSLFVSHTALCILGAPIVYVLSHGPLLRSGYLVNVDRGSSNRVDVVITRQLFRKILTDIFVGNPLNCVHVIQLHLRKG